MNQVTAILTCHNRREQTIRCLESLFEQEIDDTDIRGVLVDDGSTDGTSEAVRSCFERVEIVPADGSLFWARGMALAEAYAVRARPEFLLWLNDDVVLSPVALRNLFAAKGSDDRRVVVGALVEPATGTLTYGGADRVDWHPLRYRLVVPTDGTDVACDTFNGNVVLVPRTVYEAVGGVDGRFTHALADYDYGLRAQALGFEIVVAGTAVGECTRDFTPARWRDTSLPLLDRYRLMLSRKGVPITSSARYLRRHGGAFWPVYIAATYANVTVDHVRARIGHPRRAFGHSGSDL
jgi:GT2 family glycosyltransferase